MMWENMNGLDCTRVAEIRAQLRTVSLNILQLKKQERTVHSIYWTETEKASSICLLGTKVWMELEITNALSTTKLEISNGHDPSSVVQPHCTTGCN